MLDVVSVLKRRGIHPKKSLGQNFIVDLAFITRMISAISLRPEEEVLEIGSGLGNVTELLAARCRHLYAIELDRRLFDLARQTVSAANVTWIHDSGENFARHIPAGRLHLFSNLPYSQYHKILLKALEHPFESIHLTLQKDVVQKMRAHPGDAEYGPLSVLTALHCDVKLVCKVPKRVFYPQPAVDSVFIRLTPRRTGSDLQDAARRLQILFSYRGRTLDAFCKKFIKSPPSFPAGLRVARAAPELLLELASLIRNI
jgi:16S rRNA (adenine1518-N6/adenine1519-N6)-dimethyltransferase